MAFTKQTAVTLKSVDMAYERAMVAEAVAKNQILLEDSNEATIARAIKRRFDDLYGPSWQCVVGKSFGCYVTHQLNQFTHFYIGDYAVLLYKSV
ncbi:Dynein 8 kDa light chain, flagellar outer arm [Toxocara canis]|uniref:Dynein light chain n=2 Tax=Toxocara canis TaxID=6265 RepID=A0A0B2VIA8_TOXCA|nr:Dynein 8 kDa light chain, flagellar outer arm [Toxocara canis]VDM26646.1 unnamed protein product [Toxocara canis]